MILSSGVVILFGDLQDQIVQASKTNDEAAVRKGARAIAKISKALSIPTLASVVQVSPEPAKVIKELTEVLPDLPLHPRRGPNLFRDEPTREALAKTGRKTLALCGVATEIVVLHAALGARAEGYDVYVLLDASAGGSERTENAAIRQMEAKGCITTAISSFFTSMITDFTTPEGGATIGAIREMWGL
jgi:Isochorismatase family